MGLRHEVITPPITIAFDTLRFSVVLADVLQPLDANVGDEKREARILPAHEDRRTPARKLRLHVIGSVVDEPCQIWTGHMVVAVVADAGMSFLYPQTVATAYLHRNFASEVAEFRAALECVVRLFAKRPDSLPDDRHAWRRQVFAKPTRLRLAAVEQRTDHRAGEENRAVGHHATSGNASCVTPSSSRPDSFLPILIIGMPPTACLLSKQ